MTPPPPVELSAVVVTDTDTQLLWQQRCQLLCQLMMMRMMMMMMVSALLGLVLVSVGGLRGGLQAAALPISTVQVQVGEDATLQCPLLDNTCAVDNSTLSWYRKVEGGSPQLLLSIRSTDRSTAKLGNGISPGKVSATADGSLLLRRSDHKDSAVYYCGISQGMESKRPGPAEA